MHIQVVQIRTESNKLEIQIMFWRACQFGGDRMIITPTPGRFRSNASYYRVTLSSKTPEASEVFVLRQRIHKTLKMQTSLLKMHQHSFILSLALPQETITVTVIPQLFLYRGTRAIFYLTCHFTLNYVAKALCNSDSRSSRYVWPIHLSNFSISFL